MPRIVNALYAQPKYLSDAMNLFLFSLFFF